MDPLVLVNQVLFSSGLNPSCVDVICWCCLGSNLGAPMPDNLILSFIALASADYLSLRSHLSLAPINLIAAVPLERLLEKLDHHSLVSLVKGLVKGDKTMAQNIQHYVESVEKDKEQSSESLYYSFLRLARLTPYDESSNPSQDQKNWNKDFQTLLAQENSLEKFNQLFHLAHDFVYAARTYAKVC